MSCNQFLGMIFTKKKQYAVLLQLVFLWQVRRWTKSSWLPCTGHVSSWLIPEVRLNYQFLSDVPANNSKHLRILLFYLALLREPVGKSNTKSGEEAERLRSLSEQEESRLTCLVFHLQQKARLHQYKKRGLIPQRQSYKLPATLSNSWSKWLRGCHLICQTSPLVVYLMPKELSKPCL